MCGFSNAPMFHVSIIGDRRATRPSRASPKGAGSLTGSPPSPRRGHVRRGQDDVLVQNCNVSVGDDDFTCGGGTSGRPVTDNAYGTARGVHRQYADGEGVSNITVIDCTFNGTVNGVRIKSDNARSGLVQNISMSTSA